MRSWRPSPDCLTVASSSLGPIFPRIRGCYRPWTPVRRFRRTRRRCLRAQQRDARPGVLKRRRHQRWPCLRRLVQLGANAPTTDPDIGIQGQIFRPATETVNGTEGNDTITTYGLSEPINGLGGKDTINAAGGNDRIDGGKGKDILTGGPGLDSFVFDVKLKNSNADHLTDFTVGVDKIVLDHSIFKKLNVGELSEKAFFAHKHADEGKNGKDLIVYDTKSGELWYDKDGAWRRQEQAHRHPRQPCRHQPRGFPHRGVRRQIADEAFNGPSA